MADTTLSQDLQTWRTSNQGGSGHNGLLSKLKIGTDLYDIKDPAVEYLAGQIESRLSAVETKTIRAEALAKPNDAAKFATSVTQGTDGQVTVTYGTIRDSALDDTAVAHQFITEVDQTVDGVVSVSRAGVKDTDVELDTATKTTLGLTGTKYVSDAIDALHTADTNLVGTSSDASSDNTIYGAKAYADAAVAALAGQDWEDNAKKVQEIIAELEDSENGNAWITAIDKLSGMSIAGKTATAGDAIEYNEALTGAIKPGTELTASQASAVNAAVTGANYSEGDAISSAHAASYNATLDGAIEAGDTFTDNNVTVKEYVDAKVAIAQAAADGGISALDAVVSGNITTTNNTDAVSSGHKVGVKVTEVDGLITDVTVLENDIASASDLQTLDGAAVKTVNGVSPTTGAVTLTGDDINVGGSGDHASTKLDTAIEALYSNKANTAAITTSNVNNWSTSYANETLTWTNTSTSVYVPVSGQTL